MFDWTASLLVAIPINRYLIDSPLFPDLKLDSDGGLTIYIQNVGPFWIAMRLCHPKEEALNGIWKEPLPEPIK